MSVVVENAVIESMEIAIDYCVYSVVVYVVNEATFKRDKSKSARYFSIPPLGNPRSEAETLGSKIYALAWCLDIGLSVMSAPGRIVRVEHESGFITGISHAIHERWLRCDSKIHLVYPYYSGVPQEPAPVIQPKRKRR